MSAGASKQQIDRAIRKLRKLGYKNIRVLRASNGEVAVLGDVPKLELDKDDKREDDRDDENKKL